MTGILGFAIKAIACAGIAAGGAFAVQSHYDSELDAVSQAAISSDARAEAGVKAGAEIGSETSLGADSSVSGEATGNFALADCSDDCLEVEGLTSNEISAAAEPGLNCECVAAASSAEAEAHSTVEAQGAAELDAMAAKAGASSEAEAETEGTSSGSLAGELSLDGGVALEGK